MSAEHRQPMESGPRPAATVAADILEQLRAQANADNVAGMARFGISSVGTLGVSMPEIRRLAREAVRTLSRDLDARQELATLLWDSGLHEARIAAALTAAPERTTAEQAEQWLAAVDSWDVCDQLCQNLLRRVPFAWEIPERWAAREETFLKRAAFVVAAQLAVKDKQAPDAAFEPLLALVERGAFDPRNDVKKGVNWALRQIGKRSPGCHALAISTAEKILSATPARGGEPHEAAARWVARAALRELRSDAVLTRLGLA